jgi:hypothetical protein
LWLFCKPAARFCVAPDVSKFCSLEWHGSLAVRPRLVSVDDDFSRLTATGRLPDAVTLLLREDGRPEVPQRSENGRIRRIYVITAKTSSRLIFFPWPGWRAPGGARQDDWLTFIRRVGTSNQK